MPNPLPDPNGRPPSVPHAPRAANGDSPDPDPAILSSSGSTGSHHPAAEPLSDLLRKAGSSGRRVSATGSDFLQMLGNPGASPIAPGSSNPIENSDESPTVITRNQVVLPKRTPLPVTGDSPSIAGRRLGHFELIEAIGAGGMAAVLKARDLELGRVVALKILPPEAARDPEGISRFKQEARAAAMLDHENIARVYFCGEDQGLHFIAFEFVEGVNLRQLIDRRGTIPAAECVRYMIQVAAGLNHAAERGVVHRDIKPSNILITPDGRAKIVDMGLARHLDAVNGGVTHSGVTLGTFDYISPEQALDPRRADVRSDIYSLGCAFYHALTGRPPVPEGTAAKKLHAHQHLDPLDPREINPAIPDDLAAVLSGMMAKNPEQRYQTPADLIAHLKSVANRLHLSLELVASDSAVQAVPAKATIATEAPRLRLGWIIATAAVAIVIAAYALIPGTEARIALPSWATDSRLKMPDTTLASGSSAHSTPAPSATGVVAVGTTRALVEALAAPKIEQIHLEPGDYDLRDLDIGITTASRKLELIGAPRGVTINVTAASSMLTDPHTVSGSLAFRVESLTIRNIRFEIHAPLFPAELLGVEGGMQRLAGLTVHSAAEVNLQGCVFATRGAGLEEVAAVALVSPEVKSPHVRVDRCLFGSEKNVSNHRIALRVPSRADVIIDDSGFGPHQAAVHVAKGDDKIGDAPLAPAAVRLSRSSFMLDAGSVAVWAESPIGLSVGYCVMAAMTPDPASVPVVLQVNDTKDCSYLGVTGQKNAYFAVNPFAVGVGEDVVSYTFEECKTAELPVMDGGAAIPTQRPWANPAPLDTVLALAPWGAFELRLSDPIFFLAKDKDPDVRVIGAQFHDPQRNVRRSYAELRAWPPPFPVAMSGEPRRLVWFPSAKDGDPLTADTYADLGALLRVARSGDTILIRHTGPLTVEDTAEVKARGGAGNFKLTFKPFPGSKPILTAPGNDKLDQTIFRVLGGEVEFDEVQFLLKPSNPKKLQTVAAVSMVGGRGCTFRNCLFTLLEEDEAKATAVLVADPTTFMATDVKDRPVPEVKFERCVIRGKGRGVWMPVSRAVKVDVGQSLTALDGPFFFAEPGGKQGMNARSAIRFSHVTALIGGPLVELRASEKVGEMRTSGLVPVTVEANACLFAAVPTAGQPLVELNGIDVSEIATLIPWSVQSANRYANFDNSVAMMIIRPGGEGNMPKEWNWNQWLAYASEPAGNPQGSVTFEKGPTGLRDLAALRPIDVELKDSTFADLVDPKPGDFGADPKLLPVVPEMP